MGLTFAHEVDYWKTGSKRSPAQWVDLTINQIRDHGGKNVVSAIGELDGKEAFMLQFDLSEEGSDTV